LLVLVCALAGCNFRLGPLDAVNDGSAADDAADASLPADGAAVPRDLAGGGGDLAHVGPFLQIAALPTQASVDLTADANADWAHWGYSSASDFDHKMGGAGQISNFQQVGINAPTQFSDGLVTYDWSDGLAGPGHHPKTSANGTTTGVYVLTGGLEITAPADRTIRRLKVYVGQLNAEGQLDASLSDNSTPAVSDHSYVSTNGNPTNVTYVLTYAASSPGQLIHVSWTVVNNSLGNITLQSASLQAPAF
jgi:hypothetical protein